MLNCVILDDESASLSLLKSYCEKLPEINVVGAFSEPLTALAFIQKQPIDLLITDIDMPDLNGIELANSLSKPTNIIIISAHSEYAIAGFELDVVDYLLKPVMFPRFVKAINKVNARLAAVTQDKTVSEAVNNYLFVKDGQTRKRITLDDILYLQAQGDYILIQQTQQKHLILSTLTAFHQQLPAEQFVQIHRSTIVNLSKVDHIEKDHLVINNLDFTIGKTYREGLLKLLK